jgi:hypothetical protein
MLAARGMPWRRGWVTMAAVGHWWPPWPGCIILGFLLRRAFTERGGYNLSGFDFFDELGLLKMPSS